MKTFSKGFALSLTLSCLSFLSAAAHADIVEKSCTSNPASGYGPGHTYNNDPVSPEEKNLAWTRAINLSACPTEADMTCPAGTIDLGIVRKVALQNLSEACPASGPLQEGHCVGGNAGGPNFCVKCTVSTAVVKNCALPGA